MPQRMRAFTVCQRQPQPGTHTRAPSNPFPSAVPFANPVDADPLHVRSVSVLPGQPVRAGSVDSLFSLPDRWEALCVGLFPDPDPPVAKLAQCRCYLPAVGLGRGSAPQLNL